MHTAHGRLTFKMKKKELNYMYRKYVVGIKRRALKSSEVQIEANK